jgi:hypothetical protein
MPDYMLTDTYWHQGYPWWVDTDYPYWPEWGKAVLLDIAITDAVLTNLSVTDAVLTNLSVTVAELTNLSVTTASRTS